MHKSSGPHFDQKSAVILAVDTAVKLGLPFLVIAPKASLINWGRVAASMGAEGLLRGVINPERIRMNKVMPKLARRRTSSQERMICAMR